MLFRGKNKSPMFHCRKCTLERKSSFRVTLYVTSSKRDSNTCGLSFSPLPTGVPRRAQTTSDKARLLGQRKVKVRGELGRWPQSPGGVHQEGLTQVVPLGLGVLVNVLLRETAEEDTMEAGVQPIQVEATHMTDARLRLQVRKENWEPGILRVTGAR